MKYSLILVSLILVTYTQAGFVIDREDAKDIKALIKEAGATISQGCATGGKAIAAVILVYATISLAKALQPYIVPTEEQKLLNARSQSEREKIESKNNFTKCLLREKNSPKLPNGVPASCSQEMNLFLLKVTQPEFNDTFGKISQLV